MVELPDLRVSEVERDVVAQELRDCWNLLGPNGDNVAPEYRPWVERRLRP
jgi:hypothetical protein